MLRPLLAQASLAFTAAPAVAATYAAKPVAPVQTGKIISRDIVWACGPDACVGSTANSRPLVLCQGLAKKAGPIDSFIVNGRQIAADELARCNASAKRSDNEALANAR